MQSVMYLQQEVPAGQEDLASHIKPDPAPRPLGLKAALPTLPQGLHHLLHLPHLLHRHLRLQPPAASDAAQLGGEGAKRGKDVADPVVDGGVEGGRVGQGAVAGRVHGRAEASHSVAVSGRTHLILRHCLPCTLAHLIVPQRRQCRCGQVSGHCPVVQAGKSRPWRWKS